MSTVSSVGQSAPAYNIDSAGVNGAATGTSDDSSCLLPPPVALGGNAITQLAALMVRSDEQDQINSTNVETASDKAAAADDAARVQAMRDKASADVGQALVSGITEAVGGGLAIAGALVPSGSSGATTGTTAAPADGSRGLAGVLNGAAKVAPSLGTIFSAPYKSKADNDDANAAQSQAAADADIRAFNTAQGEAQSAADTISKIEDTLTSILQTQQATAAKVAGG
jgi:hypothetical protein